MNTTVTPSTALVTNSEKNLERRAAIFWIGFILTLLLGGVGAWIFAAVLAVRDPSIAIVPDYHAKALRWDEELETRRQSQKLGWTVRMVAGSPMTDDALASATWYVFLRDALGQPLSGARGSAQVYHHSRAKHVQSLELVEQEVGTYQMVVSAARPGLWHCDLRVDRGEDHFEWSGDLQLAR
jgi:hypothetical protein